MTDFAAIMSQVRAHAQTTGLFDRVNSHEPKNPPGRGISIAYYVDHIEPQGERSGLASTSAVMVIIGTIYQTMTLEPADNIDLVVLRAVDALFAAYSGDFDLGGTIECVDLLGQSGYKLRVDAGYQEIGDKKYRVMDVTLPLLINDMWSQAA